MQAEAAVEVRGPLPDHPSPKRLLLEIALELGGFRAAPLRAANAKCSAVVALPGILESQSAGDVG